MTKEKERLDRLLSAVEGMSLKQALDVFNSANIDSIHLLESLDTEKLIAEIIESNQEKTDTETSKTENDHEDTTQEISWRLIAHPFLRKENNTYRNGKSVPPEVKIMFTVGNGEDDDLGTMKDFSGEKIRNKDDGGLYKQPEIDEVLGVISRFIDNKGDTEVEVLSEIADIFYNLIHLTETDSDAKPTYIKGFKKLIDIIGYTSQQANLLAIAKYHYRMFKNGGKNGFKIENSFIEQLLNEGKIPKITTIQASNFAKKLKVFGKKVLLARLSTLEVEFSDKSDGLITNALISTFDEEK